MAGLAQGGRTTRSLHPIALILPTTPPLQPAMSMLLRAAPLRAAARANSRQVMQARNAHFENVVDQCVPPRKSQRRRD